MDGLVNTAQTVDKLRCPGVLGAGPGSFRRLMQGISMCRFHGVPVHINMVMTRANCSQLEAMAVLASRLGCVALCYGHCQPTPDALAAGLVLNVQKRRQVEAEIATLQTVFHLKIVLAGDHYSPSRFHQCHNCKCKSSTSTIGDI